MILHNIMLYTIKCYQKLYAIGASMTDCCFSAIKDHVTYVKLFTAHKAHTAKQALIRLASVFAKSYQILHCLLLR